MTNPKKIVICGGGVAGAGLAAALARHQDKFSITLMEKDAREDVGNVKRGEVIRPEATKVLSDTGLVEHVMKKNPIIRPAPLQEIWHSSSGLIGTMDYAILAPESPMMYLPHKLLVESLHDQLSISKVECIYSASSMSIEQSTNGRHLVSHRIADKKGEMKEHSIEADLVVVADGGASNLRRKLGIQCDTLDYKIGYSMVILDKPRELEWGRHCLNPEGFVGLFSMPNDMMRAAVEVNVEELNKWNSYKLNDVSEILSRRIPYIPNLNLHDVGFFYRVFRRQAKEFARDGIVLIGDAAHTTHPMLGQGMSMVFNDISVLSKLLVSNPSRVFEYSLLKRYEKEAMEFSSMVIDMSEQVYLAFREIGKNLNSLDEYPVLKKVGFVRAH